MMFGWCPGSVWTYIRAAFHFSARSQACMTSQLVGMGMTTPWALELLSVTSICIYLLSRNTTAIRKSRNFKPIYTGWLYRGHDPTSPGCCVGSYHVPLQTFRGLLGACRDVSNTETLSPETGFEHVLNCFNSYNRTHKLTTTHHIVDLVKHILCFLCHWRTFSVPVWLSIWQAISTTRCAEQLWSRGPFHVWFIYDSHIFLAQPEDFKLENTNLQRVWSKMI